MSGAETQKEMTVAWTRAMAVEVIRREVRGMEESTLTSMRHLGTVSHVGFLSKAR